MYSSMMQAILSLGYFLEKMSHTIARRLLSHTLAGEKVNHRSNMVNPMLASEPISF